MFLHDRTDAEAEQASQVAVWPVFQPFKGNFRWMTCLTNTSRLPVYDWWLEYEVQTEEPAGVWTVHTKKNWLNETVLPPTVPAREFLHPRTLRQLIPGDERQEWRIRRATVDSRSQRSPEPAQEREEARALGSALQRAGGEASAA
ncbi:hypothetical protein [Jiangella alba]|uniref:hypothetical protein n=1 Tax=Jiangella alba TaxID=561176 RepID=UPI00114D3982|nr:hypothetical protein [Jiangella alba]